jgi:plasmid stability protein
MRTTLTIRTDAALRRRLEQRAKAQGKTVSALAREILESALEDRPLGTRTGHLKGRIELTLPRDGFGASLRQRNWRR